jgi:hypothetical protein
MIIKDTESVDVPTSTGPMRTYLSSRSICHTTGVCGSVSVVEHSFTCPFCGEEISMVLDLSVHQHSYVEDCEVCCNPLEISYTVEDDALAQFEAKCLES